MKASDNKATVGNCVLKTTVLGYGGGGISNMYAPVSEQDARASVEAAWDAGIRLFDTAPFYGYGLAERRMGDVLGKKQRDSFLLSTKVGRLLEPRRDAEPHHFFPDSPMPFNPVFDYSYDATMRTFEDSLQRMSIDRVDILLIHDIGEIEHGDRAQEMFNQAMGGAAKALTELRDQGVVGAIGLGVNEFDVCLMALERFDLDVCLLAGRYTLMEHERTHKEFLPRIADTKVKLFIGGPFNSGIVAAEREDQRYHNYAKASKEAIDQVKELRDECERNSVDIKSAALSFSAEHPSVASVLFGARTKEEVDQNVSAFESDIPEGFWDDMGIAQYRS